MHALSPSHIPTRKEFEENIRLEFEKIIALYPQLAELVKELQSRGTLVIFGGFVRDRIHNLIHRDDLASPDLDLVLSGSLPDLPEELSRNNFGGRRRTMNGALKVDYWELERTYAFAAGLFEAKLDNLPRTTVYTVNACLFDLSSNELTEHLAVRDITSRTISFNCERYLRVFPEYQAFRAMDLSKRLGYQMHWKVKEFVRSRIREATVDEFFLAVQKHRPKITESQIEELYSQYSR